jgi:acetyl/propionyl-CoA carboxylase alpha subunit
LEVAQGEVLREVPERQGAAIEVRLYAEDPSHAYAPQSGEIYEFSFEEAEGIRVDTGVASGSVVSIHYDPMIAKIIASGSNREQARLRLLRALDRLCVLGLKTNQQQLIHILRSPDFIEDKIHTRWLEAQSHMSANPPIQAAIAALCAQLEPSRATLPGVSKGWRNSRFRDGRFCAGEFTLLWKAQGTGWLIQCGEKSHQVEFESGEEGARLWIDGQSQDVLVVEDNQAHHVWLGGGAFSLEKQSRFPESLQEEDAGACTASTPAKVAKLAVREGQIVRAGTLLVVLEAMKMEQPLSAAIDGVVKTVFVSEGDQVQAGQRLVELEASE